MKSSHKSTRLELKDYSQASLVTTLHTNVKKKNMTQAVDICHLNICESKVTHH